MMRNPRWGEGEGGMAIEPSQWGFPLSPRSGVATNRVRSEYGRAGAAERRRFDRRESESRRIADATRNPRENSTTAASITVADETPPGRRSAIAASQTPGSSRGLYNPVAIANRISNTTDRIPPSLAVTPTSAEMMLAPRASFLARKYMPQENADRAHVPTSGWRRIASSRGAEPSGGTTVNGEGSGYSGNGESEVWEWNGRRVMLHGLPAKPPLAEKGPEREVKTLGEQERGTIAAHEPLYNKFLCSVVMLFSTSIVRCLAVSQRVLELSGFA